MVSVDLGGRTAFVTGGGSGIGLQCALSLADAGATVAVADVRPDAAREVSDQIEEAGGRALAVEVDIADWSQCVQAVETTTTAVGPPDIVVNAAAVWTVERFLDLKPETWERDLRIGLEGTLKVTRCLLPGMVDLGRGSIVNISSDAGRTGESRHVVYSAAKAGVIGFTKALAKEMGRSGIRVNCVCPGATRTPGSAALVESWSEESIRRTYPLGRIGEPIDIANAVLFFASDLSDWVTGQILSVSGGYTTVG